MTGQLRLLKGTWADVASHGYGYGYGSGSGHGYGYGYGYGEKDPEKAGLNEV